MRKLSITVIKEPNTAKLQKSVQLATSLNYNCHFTMRNLLRLLSSWPSKPISFDEKGLVQYERVLLVPNLNLSHSTSRNLS